VVQVEELEYHLDELFERDLAVSIRVYLPKDLVPFIVVYEVRLRLNAPAGHLLRLDREVLRVDQLLLCLGHRSSPEYLLDLIDSNGAGMVDIKHIEDLSEPVLPDEFLRVNVRDQELTVLYRTVLVQV
jgi:hypothetical protein